MSKAKRQKRKLKGKPNDDIYLPGLKALVDRLFQEAFNLKMDWYEMAKRSGLSDTTIHKLGNEETKYPQFRTVQLLAYAVGGHVSFQQGKKAKVFKITWKVSDFNRRKKAA